ncbi:Highly acidic protein [Campylobacter sp.]|uniref:Highly acidic protein n=1 Tax=Campylobacter sp. TaxID=205 RepID=UPI003FA0BF7C
MKVALVNKNPAVSRLITLSLNKLGIEYSEFDDISNVGDTFDYIIIDSDIDSSDVNLNQKIMYLAPRGGEKPDFADVMLEKPFLPTEFISLFEQNRDTGNDVDPELGLDEPANFDDFIENNRTFGDLEDFELPEIDAELENLAKEDDKTEQLDDEILDDDFLKEQLKDLEDEDLKDQDVSFDEKDTEFADDEINNVDDTIESLDDLDENLNKSLQQDDELVVTKEEEHGDDLGGLSSLVDEIDDMNESNLIDEEAINELDKIVEQNTQNLETTDLDEEFIDDISQSKKELSEIESLDKELNEEASENLEDLEIESGSENLESELQEEFDASTLTKLEEEQNLDNGSNLVDEIKDEISEDLEEISELEPEEENFVIEDEGLEEVENLADRLNDLNFDVSSIDEIDEYTMLAAFGMEANDGSQNDKKIDADYKEELTKKITKHVHESLNESSLRDVLKDMNIKINISFEEK